MSRGTGGKRAARESERERVGRGEERDREDEERGRRTRGKEWQKVCKETFGEYRGIAASWKSPLSQECHSKFTLSQRVYFTSVYSCCAKELASETKGSREGTESRIPAEDPSCDFSSADKPLFIGHILTPLPSGVSIKGNTVFYGEYSYREFGGVED